MRFRPCIDIHNGSVKQIVGGSLRDAGNQATENFVSSYTADFYGNLYREMGLAGGHIILLNKAGTPEYEADCEQARLALSAYPGGLMIGGGMTAENAETFLAMGATHIIVTSYVFRDGKVDFERLEEMRKVCGKEHLVLDLSCRRGQKEGQEDCYYIVTDRWQNFTDVALTRDTLDRLAEYSDEYLIHAVDVEGKARGIETELAALLGGWGKMPVTYAGGVGSFADLKLLRELGQNKLDVTIGSALDLFGGNLKFQDVIAFLEED